MFDAWQQYECDNVCIHAQPEPVCLGLEPGITLPDPQPLEKGSNSPEVKYLHCNIPPRTWEFYTRNLVKLTISYLQMYEKERYLQISLWSACCSNVWQLCVSLHKYLSGGCSWWHWTKVIPGYYKASWKFSPLLCGMWHRHILNLQPVFFWFFCIVSNHDVIRLSYILVPQNRVFTVQQQYPTFLFLVSTFFALYTACYMVLIIRKYS